MKSRLGWMMVLTGCWVLSGWADEGEDRLKTSINLGGSLTRGNSKATQGNVAMTVEGETAGLGSFRAHAEGNYGESEIDGQRTTTVENARASLNVRKDLHERWFIGINTAIRYDELARIDHRFTVGPSLGAYLVKNPRAKLSVELGAMHVWEKTDGQRDDYTAYRAAERVDIVLSDTATLWQSAEYIPQANDFEDYLLVAEVGIAAAINARLTVRVVLQNQYDSRPAADVEKSDLTLIAGIGVKL